MPEGAKFGGRVKGTPNKATREIKELCRAEGPAMIEALCDLARGAESEGTRVAAIKEILDRGYGKSVQKLAGDDEEAPIRFSAIERVIVDPKAIGSDS